VGRGGMIGDSRRYDNSRLAIPCSYALPRPAGSNSFVPSIALFTLSVPPSYSARPCFLILLLLALPFLCFLRGTGNEITRPHKFTTMRRSFNQFWQAYRPQTYYRNKQSRTIPGRRGVPHPPLTRRTQWQKVGKGGLFRQLAQISYPLCGPPCRGPQGGRKRG